MEVYEKPTIVTEKLFEVDAFGGVSLFAQCRGWLSSTEWGTRPNNANEGAEKCMYPV